ncbi:MAG: sugar phosphate isomerase/epimerase [Chloroflexi bacterium]|nr:sugar phosphate isomerase/epimerase [Chloroflexota bacterium]
MSQGGIRFSVFTKPWKMPLHELGEFVRSLGFDGIEFPVRPGYQVEPENVRDLPKAAKALAEHGVEIASVAGPTDEATIAACAEAGVPIIRICPSIDRQLGYMATEARLQQEFDALVPLLDKYGVTLGIQNHCGAFVSDAMGIRHLIEKYDPRHVGAVLDAGHNGLQGEEPELALDIVWSHLCLVNFKNAFWRRVTGPEAEWARWQTYWTSGRQGLAPWPRWAAALQQRGYTGYICLTAEYSDEKAVNRLIAEDIAFAKSLFEYIVPKEMRL